MQKVSIVLGTFFGDEGKGLTTAHLSNPNSLVVRFNGGQQAGHTVIKNSYRHIYSSFGSGTMNGAHTYWSEYCTFYPKSLYNERKALIANGFNPIHFIHPLSMVTTPFDIDHNRELEGTNKHGSVGMGFGSTIARNENTPFKLYAVDLTNRDLLIHKLKNIASYYNSVDIDEQIDTFLSYVDKLELTICTLSEIKNNYEHIIFEGAQGIMLDMDFGYFPNVTRSNATSKNAIQIIKDNNLNTPKVYYTMRSYLTRHGNGFMPNEVSDFSFEDNTNLPHKYQGNFRQGYHSLGQFIYAINSDCSFSGYDFNDKVLVINCLDQTGYNVLMDFKNYELFDFLKYIKLKFGTILIGDSPKGILQNISQLKINEN